MWLVGMPLRLIGWLVMRGTSWCFGLNSKSGLAAGGGRRLVKGEESESLFSSA